MVFMGRMSRVMVFMQVVMSGSIDGLLEKPVMFGLSEAGSYIIVENLNHGFWLFVP